MDVMSAEAHRYTVERELAEAGFTPEEQADFMAAWDANEGTLTPQWRFLLNRHWDSVYGGDT